MAQYIITDESLKDLKKKILTSTKLSVDIDDMIVVLKKTEHDPMDSRKILVEVLEKGLSNVPDAQLREKIKDIIEMLGDNTIAKPLDILIRL